MPGLSVTEKQHWKERIARRIDKRIDVIGAGEPNLMDRISRVARQRALESLGLAAMRAELDGIEAHKEKLDRQQDRLHKAMLATVRRVPVEDVTDSYLGYLHQEVTDAVESRRSVHQEGADGRGYSRPGDSALTSGERCRLESPKLSYI